MFYRLRKNASLKAVAKAAIREERVAWVRYRRAENHWRSQGYGMPPSSDEWGRLRGLSVHLSRLAGLDRESIIEESAHIDNREIDR